MPLLTPDHATGGVYLRMFVADTLVPHVIGALASICEEYKWEAFGTMSVEEAVQLLTDTITTLERISNVESPFYTNILPLFAYSATNTTVTAGSVTYSVYKQRVQVGSVLNGYVDYLIWMDAGLWKMDVFMRKTPSQGIASVYLDTTLLYRYDNYDQGTVNDCHYVLEDITVLESGYHVLRFKAEDKNPSATNYYMELNYLSLSRYE